MSTLLIIGGCILGYLIIGLCWARSQAVYIQQQVNREKLEHPDLLEPWFEGRLVAYVAFWLIIVIFIFLGAIVSWVAAPVDKRRDKVGGLRARADEMATMAEGEPDSVKREIMEAVVRENRQLAEELAV